MGIPCGFGHRLAAYPLQESGGRRAAGHTTVSTKSDKRAADRRGLPRSLHPREGQLARIINRCSIPGCHRKSRTGRFTCSPAPCGHGFIAARVKASQHVSHRSRRVRRKAHVQKKTRRGSRFAPVRSDSLVEQRGFELAVRLFGFPIHETVRGSPTFPAYRPIENPHCSKAGEHPPETHRAFHRPILRLTAKKKTQPRHAGVLQSVSVFFVIYY